MLKKIDISKIGQVIDSRDIKGNLAIPSAINGYSLCIEYAKNWLFKKISRDFFNGVYVDGRYALEEFKRYDDIESQISRKNPNLAIIPNIDVSFNRDFVDFTPNMVGIDNYIRRSRYELPFFQDFNKHTKILMNMKAIQVGFTFKIKLNTRAEQLDMRDYMSIAYKVGATMGEYIDQDYHIPYDLMLNLAKDTGFEVKDRIIVDIMSFMNYLNANSILPITYKFRGLNGRNEFFIRQRNQYVHTKISELEADGGERKNHLDANFTLEMTTLVTYPVPQFYMYYSEVSHNSIPDGITPEESSRLGLYTIRLSDIPEINNSGWLLYLTTEILEKDLSKPLFVDNLIQLFESGNDVESDIQTILRWNKELHVNSSVFIDIKLFNDGNEIKNVIDWDKGTITTFDNPREPLTTMAVYVNKQYINDQLITRNAYNKTRVE